MCSDEVKFIIPNRRRRRTDIGKIVNNVLLKNGFSELPIEGNESLDDLLNLALKTLKPTNYQNQIRGKYRFDDLKNIINIDSKDAKILDFGCGDCSLAYYMETIGYHSIYATDLWGEKEEDRLPVSRFSYIVRRKGRPVIPFGIKKFRYVLCMMVLHHIPLEQIPVTLRAIHRRMEFGGFLVVREHDCRNRRVKINIDAEHFAYTTILQSVNAGKLIETDPAEQCCTYLSAEQWIDIIQQNGFRLLYYSEAKSETKKYYMLFQRTSKKTTPKKF
jgi:2-polyprenyl-3-methyl-5-hydroxy-6-metoxy-1,4-benzoquinol methylase